MATVSPGLASSLPPPRDDTVSPPSYTPAPPEHNDDKVPATAVESPINQDRIVTTTQSPSEDKIAIPHISVDDENLPEVVTGTTQPTNQQIPEKEQHNNTDSPPPPQQSWPQKGMQSPPLPSNDQPHGYNNVQTNNGYAGHESMVMSSQTLAPAGSLPPQGHNSSATVTPLQLLGDQPDQVDCPFCQHRVQTKVSRQSSRATHWLAAGLFFTTIFGVMCPYICHFANHVSHSCTNCNRKVAHRQNGQEDMQALGTPDHLREVSRFPEAPVKSKK